MLCCYAVAMLIPLLLLYCAPFSWQPSGATYALKTMQKSRIVEMSQQQNVLMEKNIMMRARHPYVRNSARDFEFSLPCRKGAAASSTS